MGVGAQANKQMSKKVEVVQKMRKIGELFKEMADLLEEDQDLVALATEVAKQPVVTTADDLEKIITNVMKELGIPANIKGHAYIRTAIMLVIEKPTLLERVTKELYPEIGKTHNTSAMRAERAIRHAIQIAWTRGNLNTIDKVFGYTINEYGKPTNSQFIAGVSEYIRLAMK